MPDEIILHSVDLAALRMNVPMYDYYGRGIALK
jgi:hypothetical protein